MKRIVMVLTAALICAAIVSAFGCAKKNDAPVPVVTEEPSKTDAPAYENIVEFENGVLKAGAFNWRYFIAKVDANMNAEVQLIDRGAELVRRLSFDRSSFTLLEGENAKRFTILVRETVQLPTGPARIAFLTNDPQLDAAGLYGGNVPDMPVIGAVGEAGFVVYVNTAPTADELAESSGN